MALDSPKFSPATVLRYMVLAVAHTWIIIYAFSHQILVKKCVLVCVPIRMVLADLVTYTRTLCNIHTCMNSMCTYRNDCIIKTDRQTNKQINRQTDTHTHRVTCTHTETHRQTYKQTDRQMYLLYHTSDIGFTSKSQCNHRVSNTTV